MLGDCLLRRHAGVDGDCMGEHRAELVNLQRTDADRERHGDGGNTIAQRNFGWREHLVYLQGLTPGSQEFLPKEVEMSIWMCANCDHQYDSEQGDLRRGIAPGPG